MSAPARVRTLADPRPLTRSGAIGRPAPAPLRPSPRPHPPLRVVDDSRRRRALRQRRARRMVLLGAVLAGMAVMALAGANAWLIGYQVRLDELHQEVAESQARYQSLRLEVATLEAPERVVSVATEELGMVAPETVTYVASAPERPNPPAPGSTSGVAPSPAPSPSGLEESASPPWGAVKPYLGGGG